MRSDALTDRRHPRIKSIAGLCQFLHMVARGAQGSGGLGFSLQDVVAAVADNNRKILTSLPLPLAGLMSLEPAETVARAYADCDALAKILGTRLTAPFMTLSFLALPVIPELKLTARGLFDVQGFSFVPVDAEKA